VSDLKISIYGRNDNSNIVDKEYPKFEDSANRLKSTGGSRRIRIVFEPTAVKSLFDVIDWGCEYRRGDVEQGGILIGNYYRDASESEEVIWGDVITIIPADSNLVNASFETINITAAAWKKMHEEADVYRAENLQILGWYHTHLDNINTRFSSVDIHTQRQQFTYEYSFGVVFNPNQKKWSSYCGPNSDECFGELILDSELENKYGEPRISIVQVRGDSELREDGTIAHHNAIDIPQFPRNSRQGNIVQPNISSRSHGNPQYEIANHANNASQLQSKTSRSGTTAKGNAEKGLLRGLIEFVFGQGNKKSSTTPKAQQTAPSIQLPQIEIKQINEVAPKIYYIYWLLPTNGSVFEHKNIPPFEVNDSDIRSVVEYMRKKNLGREILRAEFKGHPGDKSLKLLTGYANTKIVFSHDTSPTALNQLVKWVQQESGIKNTNYIFVIDEQLRHEITVHIMDLNNRR
jgi:proteasome lid subunit RPN8/RPN11